MASRLIDGVPPRYPAREELEAKEASRRLKAVIGDIFDEAERIITARDESKCRRAGTAAPGPRGSRPRENSRRD